MDESNTKIYNKQQNCSIKLIEQLADDKKIRALALFHLLKFTFVNSVIFNYRQRMKELAGRFGISEKTLYTYIRQLRENGLIVDFKGNTDNLHLAGIKTIKDELKDREKALITITDDDNIDTIACRLRAKIIEGYQTKIAFVKALRRYEKKQGKKHDLDKMAKGEGVYSPVLSLSLRTTAKVLNINEKTATKVLKTLDELGVIRLHESKPVFVCFGFIPPGYLEGYPGYKYLADAGTFVNFGTRIECLEYPVKVPKITAKLYLKLYKSKFCKKYHNY